MLKCCFSAAAFTSFLLLNLVQLGWNMQTCLDPARCVCIRKTSEPFLCLLLNPIQPKSSQSHSVPCTVTGRAPERLQTGEQCGNGYLDFTATMAFNKHTENLNLLQVRHSFYSWPMCWQSKQYAVSRYACTATDGKHRSSASSFPSMQGNQEDKGKIEAAALNAVYNYN